MQNEILTALKELSLGNFSHRIEKIDYSLSGLAKIADAVNSVALELQSNHSTLYADRKAYREMKQIHDDLMESYKTLHPDTTIMRVI